MTYNKDPVLNEPYFAELFARDRRRIVISFLEQAFEYAAINLPNDFKIWLSRHPNQQFLTKVALSLSGAKDFKDVLKKNGIDWESEIALFEDERVTLEDEYHSVTRSTRGYAPRRQ
ncbi:hypothetical protein AAAK29_31180 [Mesorhizobium sp. CCNWLW179-1]|uniref:hypothetical protein n=1 Tax=unclassified Mesorhizobium TaxID=325217 RepID=UPI0030142058